MKHVDLCSGIGGFALGFQWAGLSKPVMFCDVEPWCRKVLAKHWPDVPIEEDVKVLANEPERIPDCTILTAGYPCQPFSQAGKRRGAEDDRHIWPYINEIIAHKRPTWCVFENVYGHVSMGLDEVLSDLEGQGYATRAFIVPACGVDAPHKRDRIWIIARNMADANGKGLERQWRGNELVSAREARHTACDCGEEVRARKAWLPEPAVGRVAHGIPRRVDRLRGLGNAIVPQIAMRIGLTIRELSDG